MLKTILAPKEIALLPVVQAAMKLEGRFGNPKVLGYKNEDEKEYKFFGDKVYLYFSEYPCKGLEFQQKIHNYMKELQKDFPDYNYRFFCGPVNEENCGISISSISQSLL